MSTRAARQLVTTASRLVAARLIGAAAGLATQIVLARTLSAEELGIFFWATSIAAVLGTAAAVGYPSSALRFVSRYRDKNRPDLLSAFERLARSDTAMFSGLALTSVLAIAFLHPSVGAVERSAIAICALAIPAIAHLRLNGCLAAADRRFQLSFLPDIVFRPLLFLAVIGSATAVALEVSVLSAVALFTAATVAVALLQSALMRPRQPVATGSKAFGRLARTWRSQSGPLLIVSLYLSLFADLNLAILGAVLPKTDLAVFGVSLKLAFLLGFAIQVVHEIVSPDVADGHVRRDKRAIRLASSRANFATLSLSAFTILGAAVLGRYVLALFGEEYAKAYPMLLALLAAQLLRSLFGPSVALMTAAGLQRRTAAIFTASAVLLVSLQLILVPLYGAAGAVLAIALTYGATGLSIGVALYRALNLRTDIFAWREPAT